MTPAAPAWMPHRALLSRSFLSEHWQAMQTAQIIIKDDLLQQANDMLVSRGRQAEEEEHAPLLPGEHAPAQVTEALAHVQAEQIQQMHGKVCAPSPKAPTGCRCPGTEGRAFAFGWVHTGTARTAGRVWESGRTSTGTAWHSSRSMHTQIRLQCRCMSCKMGISRGKDGHNQRNSDTSAKMHLHPSGNHQPTAMCTQGDPAPKSSHVCEKA